MGLFFLVYLKYDYMPIKCAKLERIAIGIFVIWKFPEITEI